MRPDDLTTMLRAADPARHGVDARDARDRRADVLRRATAQATARRPARPRRPLAARAVVTAALALAVVAGLALLPASGDQRTASLPGSAVAAFAQELERSGILHVTTITRGSVDEQGRVDAGGPEMRTTTWSATDGSGSRLVTRIGAGRAVQRVYDQRAIRTYDGHGVAGSEPIGVLDDPGAPRFNHEPWAARTLHLAGRLQRGDDTRLGTEVVEGRTVTVIGVDLQPGDAYPVDQRLYVDERAQRLVRIETLELPLPRDATAAERRWQRDDVERFEILPDTPENRRRLDVDPALRAGDARPPEDP